MKSSEIIAEAWKLCKPANPGGLDYLCNAVSLVGWRLKLASPEEVNKVEDFIGYKVRAMAPDSKQSYTYAKYWKAANNTHLSDQVYSHPQYLADKQKWVDSLIAELQAMGD